MKKKEEKKKSERSDETIIDSYEFLSDKMPISIRIVKSTQDFVPLYIVTISSISKNTEIILERIRKELINEVNLGMVELTDLKKTGIVEERFTETINNLIARHFPDLDQKTAEFLVAYLIQRSLGMGSIEILMDDNNLEEVTINTAGEPVWVYHRKHGWLKTNIQVDTEDQTKHYATMIGRKVGRQISLLEPLLDAHLENGDRVNATLMPASSAGNTITMRKFATKPWTITDFLKAETLSASAAALIWLAVQYEISTLIAGGTASGKTSMLNVVTNFFPPNQRIISIEDTREIKLPKFLHWVPLVTRLPNPEGKGEISMLDLLVNSLRMRPDRIIVGEIRRKREAEVLFEAIHTGHSVYATVHANSTKETITRLISPPIEIPVAMLPALQMIIVQYRNRRTGLRKTFQISEILPDGTGSVLMQLDLKKGSLVKENQSKALMDNLETYTGMSKAEINKSLEEKEKVLLWMVKNDINDIEFVGKVMAYYYTNKDFLMNLVRNNKPLG
ncbi:MAG: type II/IV secretion system ATPase subunit [Candidatus Woesearchaeota archaeon]